MRVRVMSVEQRPVALIVQPVRDVGRDLWENRIPILFVSVVVLVWTTGFSILYSKAESIGFWNAVYFTIINITTTGFGDIHPLTDGGKIIAIANSLFGIVLFGTLVAIVTLALQARTSGTVARSKKAKASPNETVPPPEEGIHATFEGLENLFKAMDKFGIGRGVSNVNISRSGEAEGRSFIKIESSGRTKEDPIPDSKNMISIRIEISRNA
jgi:hypothetical protein